MAYDPAKLHNKYLYNDALKRVLRVLPEHISEKDLGFVLGCRDFAEDKGILTYKQLYWLGGMWKTNVNDGEYVHWDWWSEMELV